MRSVAALLVIGALAAAPAQAEVKKPEAIVTKNIPPIPDELVARTRPYQESRSASFRSWNPADRSMLITTRFGSTPQLHKVAFPKGARNQISFEAEPIGFGTYAPAGDPVLVIQADKGGNEFYQLYRLENGRPVLLTDGKSRNQFGGWSRDGKLIGYTSTRRNGTDFDIYVMDPRDPKTDRMVAQRQGGGWAFADFSPDGKRALVAQRISAAKWNIFELDIASGNLRQINDPAAEIAYGGARYAPDNSIWVTSDEGFEFYRLGRLDRATGRFTPVTREPKWDVEDFAIARDGSFIAYLINEAGISRLRLLNPATGKVRRVNQLPVGVGSGLEVAPWGAIGITLTSARSSTDTYSVDPRTLAVTRWTQSETGGLDPLVNVEPELVEIRSFDGELISGFLYRPDPRKFPGKRPLIVNIHGGPEAQERPTFLGRSNYFLNEMGIGIFYPNVRGSTGYGKRFLALDNGPYKREDSVKDIGAFLDRLAKDPRIDADRIGVSGASYGGYMCYKSAIHYGSRLKAANCSVAVANLVTVLETMESYRRDIRRVEYGDERDPVQRAKLLEISPISRASELKIPLMVAAGANDPRVPASEAEQIIKAVETNGQSPWQFLAKNEGHGLARKENADYYFWSTLLFWQQHLLGGGNPAGTAR